MSKLKYSLRFIIICVLLAAALLTSGCTKRGVAVDPSEWGYDCVVIYDALGGTVNSRGVRETYYMKNSYLFEPSGSTNLLIQPVRDGYILAGWYTAKEDILDKDGNITGYTFKAEDRWDFDEDRVQGDMTLYARWIPQGRLDYVDASTGKVMFSKNITAESPVQKLTSATESLIAKQGYTFYDYFSDEACTEPYVFSEYTHFELIPSDEDIYAQLYQEFPQYFRKIEYVEPADDEEVLNKDTSDLYVNKLGYEIVTNDVEARRQIRARKDEIIENSIKNYEVNTSHKVVYLKYIEGKYIRADNADDFKSGGKYGFTGLDASGSQADGYILINDIDFSGVSVEMTESFSGKIYGNGYSIKNIKINVASKKIDEDPSKEAGLFKNLDGAYIENVVFENMSIALNVKSGTPVTVGALAVNGSNNTLKNVTFDSLKINTGKGDDGAARYRIYDLFAGGRGNKLENVTGKNVEITASDSASVNSLFMPAKQETSEDAG